MKVLDGNPALVFNDTDITLKALKDLDLLVCNDLFVSATARHADYIMAARHPFERVDIQHMMDPFFPPPLRNTPMHWLYRPKG